MELTDYVSHVLNNTEGLKEKLPQNCILEVQFSDYKGVDIYKFTAWEADEVSLEELKTAKRIPKFDNFNPGISFYTDNLYVFGADIKRYFSFKTHFYRYSNDVLNQYTEGKLYYNGHKYLARVIIEEYPKGVFKITNRTF